MTFFVATPVTQVIPATASVWNRAISLDSVLTVPAGSTHVLLESYNSAGTGYQYGFQAAGSSEDFIFNALGRCQRFDFVPLGPNNSIDLYTGNIASLRFFVRGFTNHVQNVTPVDLTPQILTTNGATLTCDSLPDDAINGTALVMINSLSCDIFPVGEIMRKRWAHTQRQVELVKLNELKQFVLDCTAIPVAGTVQLVGYLREGAVVWSSDRAPRAVTATGVYETMTWVDTNPISFFKNWNAGTSPTYGMEQGGATTGRAGININRFNPIWQAPSVDGRFSITSSNLASEFYHIGSMVASLADTSITSINQLICGQTTIVDFSTDYTPTEITISDGTYGFTVSTFTVISPTRISFTCPSPTKDQVGSKLGNVTVVATDGVTTTPGFVSSISLPGYLTQEILSVSPDNYAAGRTPPLEVGSQALYPSQNVSLLDDGYAEFYTQTGTYTFYDRDPSDGIWRVVIYELVDSVEPPPPPLPAEGIFVKYFTTKQFNAVEFSKVTFKQPGRPE